jgi:type II secretory pathway pseudopilin PulG
MKQCPHTFVGFRGHRRGFTVLELCFAVATFSLFAVTSIYSLSQANRFASNSRYKTLAIAAAQQKIDQIMTTPWSVAGPVPAVLASGTTVESAPSVTLPLNGDPLNSASGLSSAFTNYDTQVLDSRTTVITKLTDCSGNTGDKSRVLQATVTVSYTYRGKQTNLSLTTVRGTDDF